MPKTDIDGITYVKLYQDNGMSNAPHKDSKRYDKYIICAPEVLVRGIAGVPYDKYMKWGSCKYDDLIERIWVHYPEYRAST